MKFLLLFMLINHAVAAQQDEILLQDSFSAQLKEVKLSLDKFNSFYMQTLEQKLINIMTTMTSLDANVKMVQEKAHVWDIFQYHIGAWNDHIKSVDNKLDILKMGQENTPGALDSRIGNLEFKVNHVFEKVDVINEKLHDLTKMIYALSAGNVNRGRRNDKFEVQTQGTIMKKLNVMQQQISRLEGKASSTLKIRRENNSNEDLEDILDKLNSKKLKELIEINKSAKTLEGVTKVINDMDTRTSKMYELEIDKFEQLTSCCQRNEHELTTFTSSADILLKRIEGQILKIENGQKPTVLPSAVPTTIPKIEVMPESNEGSADEDSLNVEDELSFEYPDLTGCHQLPNQIKEGVYTFATPVMNNVGRDLNKRRCVFQNYGPAWTLIQNRYHQDIQENFNRTWKEYKNGFGDLEKEFWFGNDFVHIMTFGDNMELRIELEDFEGNLVFAEYGTFRIDSETFNYNLIIADYQGNASDSMSYHNDQDFSTFDRDNDKSNFSFHCALTFGSGWWFNDCAESNLNGIYYENPIGHSYAGILWEHWIGDYSLKTTKMMIRPKDENDESVSSRSERQDP